MLITEQTLHQIGLDVCDSMLELWQRKGTSPGLSLERLSAFVTIRGESSYCLEIVADYELAKVIAEVMFAAERGSLSDLDIEDALGEIANMIGGNLKGMLGDEADLTLPVVLDARRSPWMDRQDDVRTTIDCCGSALVAIFRTTDALASMPRNLATGY
jgi:chemotaxis protein CheX